MIIFCFISCAFLVVYSRFFVAPVVGRYLAYIPVGADDTSGRTGIMMK